MCPEAHACWQTSWVPNALGIQRRDSGPCFPLISAFGCLGPWDPQHTLPHGALRFCTVPVQSSEAPLCLHPAFKKCLCSSLESLPKSLYKHYLWRLSWAEWTLQSLTWDVLSSLQKSTSGKTSACRKTRQVAGMLLHCFRNWFSWLAWIK